MFSLIVLLHCWSHPDTNTCRLAVWFEDHFFWE